MKGAWLVTTVIPSSGREIIAARALVRMVLTVDASLPGAVIKTPLLCSLHVFVILGTLAPDVMTVPLAFLAIPQILGDHVSLVSVTTTLILLIQKPVTRRQEGASSACTTQKGTTASSASMDTMVTLFGKTVESVSAITWAPCRSTVMALTATVTKPLVSACVFPM